MTTKQLTVSKEKLDINLKFYFFLKTLVKLRPSPRQVTDINEIFATVSSVDLLNKKLLDIFDGNRNKLENIQEISFKIKNELDIELFKFSFELLEVKNLLLAESKLSESIQIKALKNSHPLSCTFDNVSVMKPYTMRVYGALLSLLFFENIEKQDLNFMSSLSYVFLKDVSNSFLEFKKYSLETNQVFMLMFNESVNQSIKSSSGSNFEERIHSVLDKAGITNVIKKRDKEDKSTEYDLFFILDGVRYGIEAKRTLRERYKQFAEYEHKDVDIMMVVTLGLDLNEEMLNIITSKDNYIFVAEEVYKDNNYMQSNNMVYSASDMSIELFKHLTEK